ncbi:transcription factor DIVARICATA-like [Cornus florida]|uniref:transcription factor DIVARICATA-like n=1 Tax=Cornus florida TaxID=4283 RepID=UPI00289FD4DD|nr:transcription factor DIVARICATA-like [Cornus florida]
MGLNKYGKGDWRSISRHYVVTKNPTQVASHAQKFFRRQNSSTPRDRRRPSIHDIQSVNSTSLSLPQRHRVPPNPKPPVPAISQPFSLTHMYNPNPMTGELSQSGRVFPLGSSTFPIVNSMVTNQPSGEDHPSFRLPFFLGNQSWG